MIELPSGKLYHINHDNSLRKGVFTVKRIVNTAETYYRFNFVIITAVGIPLMLLSASPLLLVTDSIEELEIVWILPVFLLSGLPLVGFAVYYLAQYVYYRRVELDELQETVLGPTSTGRTTRLVGFRVNVIIDGREREMITKRVFNTSPMGVNHIDNYSGRTAVVGYDRNRGEIVVIG